jgi:hypothetical protein
MGRRVPLWVLVYVAALAVVAFIAVAPNPLTAALADFSAQPHSCGGG